MSDQQTPEIHIIFDGPPGPVAGRFVEVEDGDGHGLSRGEWFDRGDGTWALVLRDAVDVQELLEELDELRLQGGSARPEPDLPTIIGKQEEEMQQARLREVALELRVERAETALRAIQAWDMLRPPQVDRVPDLAWVSRMVEAALEQEDAAPGLEGEGT